MSSSESDDEIIKRFQEAADTTLINDGMFQTDPDQIIYQQGHPAKTANSKSNRYLKEEENVFQSDINVTESMKKFVGKKLSKIIEQNITFVETNNQSVRKTKTDNSIKNYGLKLFRECDSYLEVTDIEESSVTLPRNKKISIRKRAIEADNIDEKEKVRLAAINRNTILVSTKFWTNRPKAKLFEYKTNGSLNIIQGDQSEFAHLKRKNNWTMSKIATFRKKFKTQ